MPAWTPANYSSNRFRGPTPLRVALEKSLNTVTARLAAMMGMEPIGQTVEKFGIMDHMPRLLRDGARRRRDDAAAPHRGLCDARQRRQEDHADADRPHPGPQRQDDLPRRPAAMRGCAEANGRASRSRRSPTTASRSPIRSRPSRSSTMLEGVVQRGTGTAVKAVGKPIAGKTGTTNDWQDAWFVGFTPDLAAGVYVGYDEPVNLGSDETGGHLAAPIFRDFMIGGAEGRAGQGVPHAAGVADVPGQPGDRTAGRGRRAGDLGGLQARHRTRQGPDAGVAPARRSDRRRAARHRCRGAGGGEPGRFRHSGPPSSRPRSSTRRPAAPAGFIEDARLSRKGGTHFSAALTVAKWNATLPDRIRH